MSQASLPSPFINVRPWCRDKCIICRDEIDKKPVIFEDTRTGERSQPASQEPFFVFQDSPLQKPFDLEGGVSKASPGLEENASQPTPVTGKDVGVGKFCTTKTAFMVFCRLLAESSGTSFKQQQPDVNNEEEYEQAFREFSEPPPCCQQCSETLYEISRLEQVINESKVSQAQKMEALKQSMVLAPCQSWNIVDDVHNEQDDGISNNDTVHWSRFREQLVKCFEKSQHQTASSLPQKATAKSDRGLWPRVVVRRLNAQTTSLTSKQTQHKLMKNRRIKKSATDKFKSHRQQQTLGIEEIKVEPSDETMLCSNDLDRDDSQILNTSNNTITSYPPGKNKMGREAYYGTMVYRVADSLFLFKATVIRFCSVGQQFLCMEPDCSFVAKGADYAAFQWVKKHVLKKHYFEWDYDEKTRSCPVCSTVCCGDGTGTGRKFKSHMSSTHVGRPATVICETCGRFLLSQDYHIHVWTHKSKEEKVAVIQSGKDIPHQLRRRVAKRKTDPWYPLLFPQEAAANPQPTPAIRAKRRKTEKVKVKKVKRGAIGRVKRKEDETQMSTNEIFYRVNEAILMYKHTLIGVSDGGTTLTCLDPECNHGLEGNRYSTLSEQLGIDYYAVFEAIKAHVDHCHMDIHPTPTTSNSTPAKKFDEESIEHISCPLCSMTLATDKFHSTVGASLRYHLLKCHSSSLKIICEICWRPFKNYPSSHREHVWWHKNTQEKEQDEQGPPVRLLRGLTKDKINDSFLLLEERHLLLYLFTFVKYSRSDTGNRFTCQEFGCTALFEGGAIHHETFEHLRQHVESCHFNQLEYSNQYRTCPFCLLNFRDGRFLRKHLLQVHSSLSVCTHCWQPVWYHRHNRYLEEHIKLHHPSHQPVASEQNNDSTTNVNTISVTSTPTSKKKKLYPREKKYVCGQCGKSYTAHLHLRIHQDSHLDKNLRKKYDCPQCPDKFLSLRAVRNHVERKHQPELQRKRKECPHCKKQFNCKDTTLYNSHVRTHTNDKPFVCDLCGAQFHSNASLTCHRLCVHIDNRIQCEFCDKSYKTVKNLKSHQKLAHEQQN